MKRLFIALLLIAHFFCQAQSGMSVTKQQDVIFGVPNPVSCALCDSVTFLKAKLGSVFQKENQTYWLPKHPGDELYLIRLVENDSIILDSMNVRFTALSLEKMDFSLTSDKGFQYVHTDREIKLVTHPIYNYRHLYFDSIIEIKAFTIKIVDEINEIEKTIHIDGNTGYIFNELKGLSDSALIIATEVFLYCKCWDEQSNEAYKIHVVRYNTRIVH